MIMIIQGPKTYMNTLLECINHRIEEWERIKEKGLLELEALVVLSELEDLKRKILDGEFDDSVDRTVNPPKVVL